MRSTVLERPEVLVETPQCRHHWVIEAPNGPTSDGRCKHCGEVRTFSNASFELAPSVPGIGMNRPRPTAGSQKRAIEGRQRALGRG